MPLPSDSKLPAGEFERATRHVFLCIGPDCCDPASHAGLWDQLKAEAKRLSVPILRTKAACLRICKEGPWLVVYPDGIWYGRLTPERLTRILHEHVEGGRPIKEWIAAEMPGLERIGPGPSGSRTVAPTVPSARAFLPEDELCQMAKIRLTPPLA